VLGGGGLAKGLIVLRLEALRPDARVLLLEREAAVLSAVDRCPIRRKM
jgi:hypothetical protein